MEARHKITDAHRALYAEFEATPEDQKQKWVNDLKERDLLSAKAVHFLIQKSIQAARAIRLAAQEEARLHQQQVDEGKRDILASQQKIADLKAQQAALGVQCEAALRRMLRSRASVKIYNHVRWIKRFLP